MAAPWDGDRLNYQEIGTAFTNLIKSIDTAKVISIEAGFGRGKTFFRKAWSEQLRQAGEIVVELDVQLSDHSGDPLITLLGALVETLPRKNKTKGQAALASAKKLGAIGARTVAQVALRSGADELIDAATNRAIDELGDFDALDKVVKDLGEGMSKAAGQLIASQMAAERVRKVELPKQLEALHVALLQNVETNRVVVVIDELDRCHPDYAISFLEAMKLIFSQSGFVFCLMVNADYLERLAKHRFGASNDDEKYLDKFVDIRLSLTPQADAFEAAVVDLALDLPLKIPYGESEAFSVEHAAKLAGKLAFHTGFSMRKIKRILLRVELALRCYSDQPLDASLLVFLAFRDVTDEVVVKTDFLPRSYFTPEVGEEQSDTNLQSRNRLFEDQLENQLNRLVNEKAPELLDLPRERYKLPDNKSYHPWALVLLFLAPHYVPDHRNVLNSVAAVLKPED